MRLGIGFLVNDLYFSVFHYFTATFHSHFVGLFPFPTVIQTKFSFFLTLRFCHTILQYIFFFFTASPAFSLSNFYSLLSFSVPSLFTHFLPLSLVCFTAKSLTFFLSLPSTSQRFFKRLFIYFLFMLQSKKKN